MRFDTDEMLHLCVSETVDAPACEHCETCGGWGGRRLIGPPWDCEGVEIDCEDCGGANTIDDCGCL